MKELIQCTTSNQKFQQWLNVDSDPITFLDRDGNPICLMIQLKKSKDITYLVSASLQYKYILWSTEPRTRFIGAYNRMSGTLYLTRNFLDSSNCAQAELADIEAKNDPTVKDEISAKVNQYVEAAVSRELENHSVTELSSEYFNITEKLILDDKAEYYARELFFEGREPDRQFHHFQPDYALKELRESTFFAYVQDPEQFVQQAAERYIAFKRHRFLSEFYKYEVIKAKYHALFHDTTDPIHRMIAIADAVKSSGAKTVIVTIQKDDQEFTSEMKADYLTIRRTWYNALDMSSKDGHEFDRLFGFGAYFKPEEITKITYDRNTIYEAPDVQTIEMAEGVGQGPAPGGMEMIQ